LGEGERRGSPADDHPWRRRDRRIRPCRRRRRAESFDHGRDLAAWLGLVPRQFTTGGKPKLLGISKRGNKYLRKQLIHGARAALPYIAERDTPLGRWVKGLMSRTHRNVVVVALANKLARITAEKPPEIRTLIWARDGEGMVTSIVIAKINICGIFIWPFLSSGQSRRQRPSRCQHRL
jgi:hypothetical protein